MGKKNRRSKKTNNGGPLRRNGLAAVPTAPAAPDIYRIVCQLMDANNFDEILKVESKYRHLDTISNDPAEDALVLYAFGCANQLDSKDEICFERAIHYYERAKERIDAIDADTDDRRQTQKSLKSQIGMNLAGLYSEGRDMEKAISLHRWLLENGNRHEVVANYVANISDQFNRFDKFEYTIEVLEGSMDMMETVELEMLAEIYLIRAYIGCGEFLKAKAAHKKRRSTDKYHWVAGIQLGKIEEGLCNYEAAIAHFRKAVAELQKQECDGDSQNKARFVCSVDLARTLLRHSAANEAEAFAIFHEELDRRVDPLDREEILFEMGTEYRKLHKWDQSIEALHQLSCLSSTHLDGTMPPQANIAMAQTYLEQYCTDTTLTIDQRTEILCRVKPYSLKVDDVSTEMHLTQAQLFYFNGDKHEAYRHLELYLDAYLAECKLRCYTCEQRVRHGSVPFSCASCMVASYCGRKHQKMTWKNERICHKVLCPLLGYWRMAKKGKQRKESNGKGNEDRSEYVRVFETFFASICPHVKTCVPLYYDGLTFVDCEPDCTIL